jgi:hypothetical protein
MSKNLNNNSFTSIFIVTLLKRCDLLPLMSNML